MTTPQPPSVTATVTEPAKPKRPRLYLRVCPTPNIAGNHSATEAYLSESEFQPGWLLVTIPGEDEVVLDPSYYRESARELSEERDRLTRERDEARAKHAELMRYHVKLTYSYNNLEKERDRLKEGIRTHDTYSQCILVPLGVWNQIKPERDGLKSQLDAERKAHKATLGVLRGLCRRIRHELNCAPINCPALRQFEAEMMISTLDAQPHPGQ